MEPGTPAKGAALVLLVACGALGLYAYQQKKAVDIHQNARGDLSTKLDACNKSLDDEKKTREACEKSATDANATLTSNKSELDELRKAKEDADKRAAVFKSITEKMKSLIDSGKLQVVMRHGRMVVKLPAGVLFASGSAELSKDGLDAVSQVAHILRQFPDRQFEVAGHTDNIAIMPTAASPYRTNLELSAARAVMVAQALEKGGMNPWHLSAAGYAEFQPVASNKNEPGRQENRRIEIVLVPNLAELSNIDADGGAP